MLTAETLGRREGRRNAVLDFPRRPGVSAVKENL
jgi:hypothetical protein